MGGSGEAGTPTKTPKTSAAQDQSSPPAAPYPPADWAAAFQAYYNAGATPPPGYYPPSVGSGPQPHHYGMWGAAQAMIPPYGTPPYGTMYPHYGMPPGAPPHYGQYPMPAPGSTNDASAAAATDTDGKSSDGKERSPMKRSKGSLGSLGMLNNKGTEGKGSGSANGIVSQSGESGSEGSSEGSDEDMQNASDKRSMEQMGVEGSGAMANSGAYAGQAFSAPGVAAPNQGTGKAPVGTNLNMGMDYWGSGAPGSQSSSGKGKRSSQAMVSSMQGSGQMMPHGRDGVPPELWLQDERELKRQRRKQSNRESARRSRLRKQAECEELAQRVDSLTVENMSLRQELEQLVQERDKLSAENASLMEQLDKGRGGDVLVEENGGVDDEGHVVVTGLNGGATMTRVEGENCETVSKVGLDGGGGGGGSGGGGGGRAEAVAAAG